MVKRKSRKATRSHRSGDKNTHYVVASVSAVIAFALLIFILQNMSIV